MGGPWVTGRQAEGMHRISSRPRPPDFHYHVLPTCTALPLGLPVVSDSASMSGVTGAEAAVSHTSRPANGAFQKKAHRMCETCVTQGKQDSFIHCVMLAEDPLCSRSWSPAVKGVRTDR